MLDELRIRGLGVINDAVLPLGPGLTVVTGETGAGKTMVVSGLLLLFGGRGDPARVRVGADQASVEGRLLVGGNDAVRARVDAAGGQLDDDTELVLRRVVTGSGRSRAYVGGAAAPVGVLAELAEHLVTVHGQSDQIRLVRATEQRAALDRFAGVDLRPYTEAYAAWRRADSALTNRVGHAAELRRESELLAHGLAEIEAVAPYPGEFEELTRVAGRLGHADALKLAARQAHDALVGDYDDPAAEAGDVTQLMGAAARALAAQRGADTELDAHATRLIELASLAAELGADLGSYADHLDTDPARLQEVEQRRAAVTALIRKYCDDPEPGIAGVLRWADAARARLGAIDVSDEALDALRRKRDQAAQVAARLAADVSARRTASAQTLARAVNAELAGLAMPDAQLHVTVRGRPVGPAPALVVDGEARGATADGTDEVELLLQSHPTAPALPIGKGASGGELSRIMLAIEVCLADTHPVPTLVFDEVDAGVGGRAAVEVGRRLARLGRDRQVLVVTHLPQVAAFADVHIVVDKPSDRDSGSVTASDVRALTDEARIVELARMLAGSDTDTAREHAAELLTEARGDAAGARRPGRTRPAKRSK